MSTIAIWSFCRALLCISAAYAVTRCLSVCLSVTFVSCVKTNKDIFEFFSPSGSQAILVLTSQTGWRYSDGNPLTGTSNAGGVGRNRDSEPISLQCLLLPLQHARCCQQGRRWQGSFRGGTPFPLLKCLRTHRKGYKIDLIWFDLLIHRLPT